MPENVAPVPITPLTEPKIELPAAGLESRSESNATLVDGDHGAPPAQQDEEGQEEAQPAADPRKESFAGISELNASLVAELERFDESMHAPTVNISGFRRGSSSSIQERTSRLSTPTLLFENEPVEEDQFEMNPDFMPDLDDAFQPMEDKQLPASPATPEVVPAAKPSAKRSFLGRFKSAKSGSHSMSAGQTPAAVKTRTARSVSNASLRHNNLNRTPSNASLRSITSLGKARIKMRSPSSASMRSSAGLEASRSPASGLASGAARKSALKRLSTRKKKIARQRSNQTFLTAENISVLLYGLGLEDDDMRTQYTDALLKELDPTGQGGVSHMVLAEAILSEGRRAVESKDPSHPASKLDLSQVSKQKRSKKRTKRKVLKFTWLFVACSWCTCRRYSLRLRRRPAALVARPPLPLAVVAGLQT